MRRQFPERDAAGVVREFPFGQEFAERIIEGDGAALDLNGEAERREDLGQGANLEECLPVRGTWLVARAGGAEAEGVLLAVLEDADERAAEGVWSGRGRW